MLLTLAAFQHRPFAGNSDFLHPVGPGILLNPLEQFLQASAENISPHKSVKMDHMEIKSLGLADIGTTTPGTCQRTGENINDQARRKPLVTRPFQTKPLFRCMASPVLRPSRFPVCRS